ncbi:hypothetical protein [Petrotoga sp. 9PWA.NaAc.5.4]|uniref:hypothetical protein n=1 Tax=Petrotoga sp. 9PWA.NaAc.5.4 TaxID=1434328 RepID=UPI000CB270DB|nr:hypothetical protein [Petrotoga sp. 9PWA.NaAc.5.4]PNR95805.1 hypothetical protein X924_03955 [Petrotoga sp. 9PWA.NaAc.5.4]
MQLKKFSLLISIMLILSFTFASEYDIINKELKIEGKFFDSLSELEKIELEKDILVGYLLNLQEIDPKLSYSTLGTMRNYNLIQQFCRELGYYLKKLGIDFVVFGNLQTSNKQSENPQEFISDSPYLISEVIYRMIRGFETSGVLPVIIVSSNDNKNAVDSLLLKCGSFYSYSEDLKGVDLIFDGELVHLESNNFFMLPWSYGEGNLREKIQEIINNTTTSLL